MIASFPIALRLLATEPHREADVVVAVEARGLPVAQRWTEGDRVALEVRRQA